MTRWIMGVGVLALAVSMSGTPVHAEKKSEAKKATKEMKAGKESMAAEKMESAARKFDEKKTKALYNAKCKMCHGAKGEGNPAMAKAFKLDAAALALNAKSLKDKDDADLVKITTDGKGKMPAYKGKLKESEIQDLIAYSRTLGLK